MKWNRFIVSEATQRRSSPVSHLDASRRSSQSKNSKFTLKSCHKIHHTPSHSVIMTAKKTLEQQENLNDVAIRNMVSRISIGQSSRVETEKIQQNSQQQKESPLSRAQELQKLTNSFFQQLENFFSQFFSQYEHLRMSQWEGQTIVKRITDNFEAHLKEYLENNNRLFSQVVTAVQKHPSSFENSSAEKRGNRVIQFKNQKINEKQGVMVQSQESILQSQPRKGYTRTQKFERRSINRLRDSKRERSFDSSAGDIIEKSFNDSYRSSKSRLKAKQAFYQFSKVLNQNNA